LVCLPEYRFVWLICVIAYSNCNNKHLNNIYNYCKLLLNRSRVKSMKNVSSSNKIIIRIQYLSIAYLLMATSSLNSKTFIVLNCIGLTTSVIRLRLIKLRFIILGEGKIVNVHGSREVQVSCFLCCRWNLILRCNRGRTTTGVFIFYFLKNGYWVDAFQNASGHSSTQL